LAIAAFCPEKKILMLTYNAFLKEEVRQRALDYENLEVHSYHALAASYFPFVPTKGYDRALRCILEKKLQARREIPLFDLIFIDECQDMRALYFDFVRYFVQKLQEQTAFKNLQFVLCGDRHQEMYAYLGADRRYLTQGSEVLKALGSEAAVRELKLSQSYRLTDKMSSFLNSAVLGEERIFTQKEGTAVSYLEIDPYQTASYLDSFIASIGYSVDPGDVFVLAPSVKTNSNSAVMALECYFCTLSIPVFLAEHDIKSNTRTSRGKVEFTTFHRAKGRERSYVIVFGFDAGYFDFFGKDYSCDTVPDTLYVALTRSSKWLAVISDSKYRSLEFLRKDQLLASEEICSSILDFSEQTLKQNNKCVYCSDRNPRSSITDFIKHLPESLLDSLIDPVEQLFTPVTSAIYSTRLCTEVPQISKKGKT
jgi:superfamily I DNA/RNA helicase